MKTKYLFSLVFFGMGWGGFLFHGDAGKHQPLHFALEKEYEAVVQQEQVFTFMGKDTLLEHSVSLLYDEQGFPLLYYSDILTPVCIDNVCKPMAIEVYWNLLGRYVGYGVHSDQLLTKYDHDLFEKTDYEKLHQLLLNRHSILERRKLSDLFDAGTAAKEKVKFKGVEVDAVSGATKKEIKESVVEGALYSCYTIWHLVHGEAAQRMTLRLDTLYTSQLAAYFIQSNYQDYQLYAIKHLSATSFGKYLPRIMEIFNESKPLTRTYILKKLPKELWQEDQTTDLLYQNFADLDINSKTLLINNLEYADLKAVELLVGQVKAMTRNHLQLYLNFLATDPAYINDNLLGELKKVALDDRYPYSYLIETFLAER